MSNPISNLIKSKCNEVSSSRLIRVCGTYPGLRQVSTISILCLLPAALTAQWKTPSAHNTHASKRERTLTLLLTSAESPNDGPLLKCCDMMRSDYLQFRELVSDAAAGHVFRHWHRLLAVQIRRNPIL